MERTLADLADPFAMSPLPPEGRGLSLADLGMIGSAVSQGLAQWLAKPGRALRGEYDVTPEVPGQWSEADEYRLQLANRELVDWGPQTALAMLGLSRLPGGAPLNALGTGGGKLVQPDLPAATSPNFIVSPSGTTFPVPTGATGPLPARTGRGVKYEGGSGGYGFDPRTSGLRIMDPRLYPYPYPTGYGVYMNRHEQTVNPFTGRTLHKSDPYSHIKR